MLGRLIGTVRRNHALEHATIAVLLQRIGHDVRMVGRASNDGYYLYADVPTELLESATHEALRRMQSGEGYLAVSPFCGTNLAVAGALAGVASLVTMGQGGRRGEKVPNVILASMLAVLAAQPVGRLVQRHLTTSPDLGDTQIVGIKAGGRGGARFHKVLTRRSG